MSSNKIRKLENQKQEWYDGGIFPISPPVTSSIQHLNKDPKPIGRASFNAPSGRPKGGGRPHSSFAVPPVK